MSRFDREWKLLLAARTWIKAGGLRLVESRGPEGMDNGYDIYESDRLGLRIVADRGQWFVEVHPGVDGLHGAASQTWFTLEQWSSCVDAPVLFHDTRPARSDAEIAAALD